MLGRHNNNPKNKHARWLCALLIASAVMLWIYLAPLGPATKVWLLAALALIAVGVGLTRRYYWVRRAALGGSLVSLTLAVSMAESSLPWVALSFLYLFIWV